MKRKDVRRKSGAEGVYKEREEATLARASYPQRSFVSPGYTYLNCHPQPLCLFITPSFKQPFLRVQEAITFKPAGRTALTGDATGDVWPKSASDSATSCHIPEQRH